VPHEGEQAFGRPAELPGQVPRATFRRERDGLLLTKRGDAVVVVGQEPAIVGERELSVVDRHLAVPGGDLGTQVRQLIRAHRIEADPIEIQLLFD
jgi:hypothetical protein